MNAVSPNRKPNTQCKICTTPCELFDEAKVLHKYSVQYFRCPTCGFIQTESPYWLEEAYSSAITKLDTGILLRNVQNHRYVTAVINLLFPEAKSFLDFGAGHGILVRLMRDSGFDFSWYDLHATNDYARGFEHQENQTYDFLTSFEVLEHLVDPIEGLSEMMDRSPNVLVSTDVVSQNAPKVSDWWYYCTSAGQHVSFYSMEALRLIAKRFGKHLLSHGSYHLFSTAPKSAAMFRLATSERPSKVINLVRRRPSLVASDFDLMSK